MAWPGPPVSPWIVGGRVSRLRANRVDYQPSQQVELGDLGLDLSSLTSLVGKATTAARSQIRAARFRSQLTPEITLDLSQPGAPAANGGGPSGWLLSLIKPAVYVDTNLGTVTLAPGGEPTRNFFPLVALLGVVGGGLAIGLLVRALRR